MKMGELREAFMPHWLRNSTIALLACLAAGCGSSGLFGRKPSYSALPSAVGANRSTSLRELSSTKPPMLPDTRPAMTSAKLDKEEIAVVETPLKTDAASITRIADSEPAQPKPMNRRDGPIPAAFAVATPNRTIRDIESASHDAAFDRQTGDSDMISFAEAEGGSKTPVSTASARRTPQGESDSASSAGRVESAAANNAAERLEPGVAASPIPKAVSSRKLAIGNVALCQEIISFGDVVRISGPMRPGEKAIVYIETTGQSTTRTSKGLETRLHAKLRLTPTSGGPTMEWRFDDIVDESPTERTQFFCHMVLSLPDSMTEGDYRLEAVLDDVHGGTSAAEGLSLRVEPATATTK
jgi:hypothetical protein